MAKPLRQEKYRQYLELAKDIPSSTLQEFELCLESFNRTQLIQTIAHMELELLEVRRVQEKIRSNQDLVTARELATVLKMSVSAVNQRVQSLTQKGWLAKREESNSCKGSRRYFEPREAEIILQNPKGKKRRSLPKR